MRRLLDVFNGILMIIMFITIFVQIFARVVLQTSTTWSTEFGVIMFTFIVLFGLPNITRERGHIKVDAVYSLFPGRLKTLSDLVCGVVYVAFFGYMIWGAYGNVVDNWEVEIPSMEWCRMGWVYLAMLVAIVLHILALAVNIWEDGLALLKGGGRCSSS